VFDNEVPYDWRADLFEMIQETPYLTWLLLTKRIGNVERLTPFFLPVNVWLGATIVNQEEADRDVPKLLATDAVVKFVSYEPALGPVDWTRYPGIDWIIVGGESTQGAQAREFDIEWAYNTITQAVDIGAAPFVKQLGSRQGLKDRAGANPAEWPIDLRVQEFPASRY
jgi:protein gp37